MRQSTLRLHLLEHEPDYFTETNIAIWAKKNDYTITKTDVFNQEPFPHQDDFDWLMIMGGFQHIWQEEANRWKNFWIIWTGNLQGP